MVQRDIEREVGNLMLWFKLPFGDITYKQQSKQIWKYSSVFHFNALEKEMATHSSVLAWRIPGMGEPGRLLSMGSHRVGHNWSDLAVAAAW